MASAVATAAREVVFYISGHGFGHASREVEIINALGHARPDLRTVIRSAVSPGLLARTVTSRPASVTVNDDAVDEADVETLVFRLGTRITRADGTLAPYNFVVDPTPFVITIVDNDHR